MTVHRSPRGQLSWSERESGLRLDKEEGAASLLVSSFLFGQVRNLLSQFVTASWTVGFLTLHEIYVDNVQNMMYTLLKYR